MEILFLWISRYGSIKNQGFNLSGDLKFLYNIVSKELTVTNNENYINDFFIIDRNSSTANILNLTAVVGANGAGKSTFLDFIKNNLPYDIGGINSPCIAVIRTEDGKKVIYHHESILIKQGNYTDYGFITEQFKEVKLTEIVSSNYKIPDLSDVSFIYFSNIFDNKEEQSLGNLHNISTNYLLKSDRKSLIETKVYDYSISETKAFQQQEVQRQLKFIGEASNNRMVPFDLPEYLFITPIDLKPDYKNYKQYSQLVETISVLIDKHYKRRINLIRNGSDSFKEEYRRKFYRALTINFFYELENNNMTNEFRNANFNIDNEEGYTIYEKIQDMFISAEVLTELVEDDLPRRSSIGISSFILFIEDLINESDLNYQQQLKIKVSDISKIEAFLTLYQKTFLFNQYMQFSWSGLSSGEQALLNVFSRFFSLSDSQSIHGNSELKKNVVVLIDEGELYFHPQWQKMLLSILIEFLPRVLSSKSVRRNLQIIITSNSPFILSDLPTANVIFLENNGENTCVKEKSSNESKTFGANIYSLYADSFFIQDGLIGEFAKQKINDLVDLFLNKDRRNELYESEEYIEKLINMVAEPVLRNKLLSLFKEKFIVNMKDKQREIFYLENRLRALKEMDTNDKN